MSRLVLILAVVFILVIVFGLPALESTVADILSEWEAIRP